MEWVMRGRCWKFGDNIACDGDMAPLNLVHARETRPEVLREHAMTGLDPDFPKKVKAGDIIVAGRRFGTGHAHPQGAFAIAAVRVGLVIESVPRGNFRNLVIAGIPTIPRAAGVGALCATGDELEVDFERGLFRNLTRGAEARYEPLPPMLRRTIALGGWKPMVRQRIAEMRAAAGARP